jgi:hypothetical protein
MGNSLCYYYPANIKHFGNATLGKNNGVLEMEIDLKQIEENGK